MIVKDEVDVLERCLASTRPYVSEVNIYDTGSTDGTLELLEKLARQPGPQIRVERGEWRDDFAWAREQSFAMASEECEWLMWLDADDLLMEGWLLPHLLAAAPPDIGGFDLLYHRRELGRLFACDPIRVVRRSANYRWRGAVHELLLPPSGQTKLAQPSLVYIVHAPSEAKEAGQYVSMIEHHLARVRAAGGEVDPWVLLSLGEELAAADRYDEAAQAFRGALEDPDCPERRCCIAQLALALQVTGRADEARALVEEVMRDEPEWSESKNLRATVCIGQGDLGQLLTSTHTIGFEDERYGVRAAWQPDDHVPDAVRATIEERRARLEALGLACPERPGSWSEAWDEMRVGVGLS